MGRLGNLMGQHGAHHAVDVDYRQLNIDHLAVEQSGLSQTNEFVVESFFQPVILFHDPIQLCVVIDDRSGGQDGAEIQASSFPVLQCLVHFQNINSADHLIDSAEAEFGHDQTHFFSDHKEVIDDALGFTVEFLA